MLYDFALPNRLNRHSPDLFQSLARDFLMFFPDRNLSVHAAQSIPIHSILKDSRKPVRKIPANVTLLLTIKPEVRICQPAVSCITKKSARYNPLDVSRALSPELCHRQTYLFSCFCRIPQNQLVTKLRLLILRIFSQHPHHLQTGFPPQPPGQMGAD